MSDEDWFKEYQKNVDSNAKWRSRKEQKALNDKWDKSDMTQTDREKLVRILELLEKTVGNLDWVQIRLESPKHCSDTITEIKKILEK